jgi:predicted NBD/HSP70 family sugar kinase
MRLRIGIDLGGSKIEILALEDGGERLGPPCYRGKTGCIETFLSGPGLARDHERRSGEHLEPPQIAERAAAGDPACEASLQRYEARLAKSLATVINLLDPK